MSRAGILKRPGAFRSRSRRRTPSPVLGGAGKIRRFYDYKGRLAKGQALAIASIPQNFWEFGERYLFTGDYWGKQCQIIGTLDCLTVGRGGTHANLILEGTDNQDMLKWAEGLIQTGYPPEIAVHLCPTNCPQSASLDRRSAWANSQSRGQGSGLVRECRIDTSREQPGRISKRVIESFQRGRGFERV